MDNVCISGELIELLDEIISEKHLDEKIKETHSLTSLITFLKIKQKRIAEGKSKEICYPLDMLWNKEYGDLLLQCELLKTIFLVTGTDEILNVIMYLNSQFDQVNSNFHMAPKVAQFLKEVMLICISRKEEKLFQDNMSLDQLEHFLLFAVQTTGPLKSYILSVVLKNYIILLNELQQVIFIQKVFLKCKELHNLDIICVIINCIDDKVIRNCESIFYLHEFWQYLASCISCGTNDQQKQATFIVKKCVQVVHKSNLTNKIHYLQTVSEHHESSMKIWQNFFTLLEASKEKQLHLIWPSLTLLPSLRCFNNVWQICIYKRLLKHTQNVVVYFVASHIMHEKVYLPSLNKHFLSAINKNEYIDYSVAIFGQLSMFCNRLETEEFSTFLDDILEITWIPAAVWCLFSNIFTEKLIKNIPFKVIEPMCKLLRQLPHIYIRNGCFSIFLQYVVRTYHWKHKFDEALKLLFILKEYNNKIFVNAIINYIDLDFLNVILHRLSSSDLDDRTFVIFIQIFQILKFDLGIESVVKNTEIFNEQLLLVMYGNLYEKCKQSNIEQFILDHITKLEESTIEMYSLIIDKYVNYHQDLPESLHSKVLFILNKPSTFNKSTLHIAMYICLKSFKTYQELKKIMIGLEHHIFNSGKTNDDLCILFLELYFLTEDYPQILFLEQILHNQSDAVISKMFQSLCALKLPKNDAEIIQFLKEAVNILPLLSKRRNFKNVVFHYIKCIFSIKFSEISCEVEMLNIFKWVIDSLLSMSETFPLIDYYLSDKIKEVTLLPNISKEFSYLLMPVSVELLLRGTIIKKDDRIEYYICQDIYKKIHNSIDNPNFIKTSTRMSSFESMLQLVSRESKCADDVASRLMEKYRMYFNKRYFPDSQIHLQKLRIIQVLLTIHTYIKDQRQPLIDLIMECFCTEIHQPCVKQLMQWLLLCLMVTHDHDCFHLITAKIDATCKTQPSSIAACIVVLLHLTLCKEESYWFLAVEAMIPWSMGAHFKLRVYSQAAIKKLLEEARKKNFQHFLKKYIYLEKSILSVIEATGNAFDDTLKSDELIFSKFNPKEHYSLETIFVDIPRLNGITKTEWENILEYKFLTFKNIDIYNRNRSFSEAITKSIQNRSKTEDKTMENLLKNNEHIQRKIVPEEENNKPTSDFILIASLVDKSTNLGGLSRTCEVFRVKHLVLNDVKILKDKEFKSLSMSSEDWIDAVEVKESELKNYILDVRSKGYSVVGAEQTSESICLHKYKFDKKTALVLGNEKEGIPPDIIPILDACIEIPQFGLVRSLNVHVAGATFIWEYAKQHLMR